MCHLIFVPHLSTRPSLFTYFTLSSDYSTQLEISNTQTFDKLKRSNFNEYGVLPTLILVDSVISGGWRREAIYNQLINSSTLSIWEEELLAKKVVMVKEKSFKNLFFLIALSICQYCPKHYSAEMKAKGRDREMIDGDNLLT